MGSLAATRVGTVMAVWPGNRLDTRSSLEQMYTNVCGLGEVICPVSGDCRTHEQDPDLEAMGALGRVWPSVRVRVCTRPLACTHMGTWVCLCVYT